MPPPTDVQVAYPKGVQSHEAIAGDYPRRVRPRRSTSRAGRPQVPLAYVPVGAPEDYAPGGIGL